MIARSVIPRGVPQTPTVEMYPLELIFLTSQNMNRIVEREFSKVEKVGVMKRKMCEELGLDEERVRVWTYYAGVRFSQVDRREETVDEARLVRGQKILLELLNSDGTWLDGICVDL